MVVVNWRVVHMYLAIMQVHVATGIIVIKKLHLVHPCSEVCKHKEKENKNLLVAYTLASV